MANFSPSFTKQFTNTCQTLTVTDTSNYGSNDENYTKDTFPTKIVTLYDINQTILASSGLDATGKAIFNLPLLGINQVYLIIGLSMYTIGTGYDYRQGSLLPCIL